ncbi:MAG: hypothetical protein M1834_005080 [Cirrosporium novae-zelandiae]|nr:MAG: hypothetical protein M1834_005080 [Cirrosporium novae-zelandiae]
MSPKSEDDDWVFDTIKATTAVSNTQKRRKPIVNRRESLEPPVNMMQDFSFDENGASGNGAYSTMRKINEDKPSPATRRMSAARRQSGIQKQPLAPSMSFGNDGSSLRPFRRVSGGEDSMYPATDENSAPDSEPLTKEGMLGQRVFSKIIDPALQNMYANTSSRDKGHALARVAEAWSILDSTDPEGEYLLLKLMVEKIQSDPKLSAALLPPSPPAKSPPKQKLVLAQNNPHLKNHRRRQSTQMPSGESKVAEPLECLPGLSTPGMEHTKQLADVLYERWSSGLKNRWPAV